MLKGSSTVGCSTATSEEVELKSIPSKIQTLEKAIAGLYDELGYLANDIAPILSPLPPQEVRDGANKVSGGGCPVGHKLQSLIEAVQVITVAVGNLRSRVEV